MPHTDRIEARYKIYESLFPFVHGVATDKAALSTFLTPLVYYKTYVNALPYISTYVITLLFEETYSKWFLLR